MKTLIIGCAVAALAASPALAGDNGKGKGHDKGKAAHSATHHGVHTSTHAGPPGLAKKPGGMPPGQYKKRFARGQRLPSTYLNSNYYVRPSLYDDYNLRAAPAGYRWVRVEDQAYMVQQRTGTISQVAQIAAALLAR